jgi:hypothetical protein
MAALGAAICGFPCWNPRGARNVGGRAKPGHDGQAPVRH